MDVGAPDGFGRFAVVDEQTGGLLCHECGRTFAHLGLHVYKAHGISANCLALEVRGGILACKDVSRTVSATCLATIDG